MTQHNVKWKVGLSNGETFFEGKTPFDPQDGELSPWQRLQNYLYNNQTDITSLSLYTDEGQTWHLPSLGKNPKFKAFEEARKPLDFNFFHVVGQNIKVSRDSGRFIGEREEASDNFAVIEAIYSSHKLQIWVDNNNTQNSWTLVV